MTLFVGALLLFAVQPMAGRMLLPLLGGSPAVWNTCLVFFQGMLLLGYLYSHLTTRYLGIARQAVVHLALLAGILLALPITVPRSSAPGEWPALWLLQSLFISVGLPFVVVATTSPLLQRWYAGTRSRRAHDPYFLSMASNLGSLVALVAYPVVIEPALKLSEQSDWWRWGYVGYLSLIAVCAVVIWVSRGAAAEREASRSAAASRLTHVVPAYARWRWVLLAFLPASLLTGVTQAITTDVAPIPLLWVIPLALYLVTFIVAFAPGVRLPVHLIGKVLAIAAVAWSFTMLAGATEPLWLVLPIHLATFFVAALLCHARLAAERPPADRLTSYYLWMSLGGVLGGAFNALVAPVLFQRLGFVEYPLILLAVLVVRPGSDTRSRVGPWDIGGPVLLGIVVAGIILLAQTPVAGGWVAELSASTSLPVEMLRSAACFGLPLVVAYFFVDRPVRFALGLGALFLASVLDPGAQGRPLHIERNFLGVIKITTSPDGQFTRMVHGNTVHGQQRNGTRTQYVASYTLPLGATHPLQGLSVLAAADGRWDDRHRPLTYYHPAGPAGVTFRFLVDGWRGPRRIGAVGLGTGAIASYARPNQDWTFYELDPAVERLARDERYFTLLRDSPARSLHVVIGDARLRLAAEPDRAFDLLVLDAFSSDAIPVHLLTGEAFALYERKLAPNGVILMHLSNRYLDLPPVVAKVAQTMSPPLVVRQNDDMGITDREREDGKSPSVWVILARRDEDFGPLAKPIRGFLPARESDAPRWTDDRADLLGAFRRTDDD